MSNTHQNWVLMIEIALLIFISTHINSFRFILKTACFNTSKQLIEIKLNVAMDIGLGIYLRPYPSFLMAAFRLPFQTKLRFKRKFTLQLFFFLLLNLI